MGIGIGIVVGILMSLVTVLMISSKPYEAPEGYGYINTEKSKIEFDKTDWIKIMGLEYDNKNIVYEILFGEITDEEIIKIFIENKIKFNYLENKNNK